MQPRRSERENKGKPPVRLIAQVSEMETPSRSTSKRPRQGEAGEDETPGEAAAPMTQPSTVDPALLLVQQLCRMNEDMMALHRSANDQHAARMEMERLWHEERRQERLAERRSSNSDVLALQNLAREQAATINNLTAQIAELNMNMQSAHAPPDHATHQAATVDERTHVHIGLAPQPPRDESHFVPAVTAGEQQSIFAAPSTLSQSSRFSSQSAIHGHKKLNELPTFTGRTEEWCMFIAAFRNSTAAYGYDATDNAFRLQKCLAGPAREAVSNMINDGRDVEAAIETLELLYGQPIMLIRCEIDKARSYQPIQGDHLEQWAPFAAKVRNLAAVLDTDATKQHLSNPILLDELVQKLPATERLLWSDVADGIEPIATVHHFAEWVTTMAKRASRVVTQPSDIQAGGSGQRRSQGSDRRPGKSNVILMTNEKNNPNVPSSSCSLCQGKHMLAECRNFQRMDPASRWTEVKKLRACFRCLKTGHPFAKCRSRARCSADNCQRIHHPMLHESQGAAAPPVAVAPPAAVASGSTSAADGGASTAPPYAPLLINSGAAAERSTELLMRILPVKLHGPNRVISTYALFDEAAKVTLMDEAVANDLELSGAECELRLTWYGGKSSDEHSRIVDLHISGVGSKTHAYSMSNVRTVKNLQLPKQTLRMSELHSRYRHIKSLPIAGYRDVSPKILLGLEHSNLGMPKRVVEGDDDRLVATKTKLGWMLYGRIGSRLEGEKHVLIVDDTSDDMESLHETVRQYHTTESFGVRGCAQLLESNADTRARQLLRDTTVRRGTRFETGLLWASDDVQLPHSRSMAISRLSSVESRMAKDPKFAALYEENIQSYVRKGYARLLTPAEAAIETPRTWYLPHFGVENVNKPNKVRLVFDAAAKVSGSSLNSALLTGPDELASLTKILHQFRVGTIGVSGDIQEMFHQIVIRPEDQDSQRFVWRHGDKCKPIETYVMQSMTFGARCSPCSAQFVKNLNASEHQIEDPAAVDAIVNHHYVDDYVISFATTGEATRTTKAVIDIHRRGGFNLRNFRSNCPDVLRALGCDGAGEPVDLRLEATPEKILGMFWDSVTDEFTFKLNLHHIEKDVATLQKPPTKRQILSVAMSVFDPYGILCDFMLHAKLMVQEVWRIGCGWDEPVPLAVMSKWSAWMTALKEIDRCRLPRCYSPHLLSSADVQLHIFADASEAAFAAVAYWRIVREDGEIDVAFVTGKTRCAPVKLLTVPRLELQAAVLATRLRSSVVECHEVQVSQTHFWSDSMTVLRWIESDHRRYKPFVGHRIAEILESSTENEWHYIPTAQNVADDATRAKCPPQFDPQSRWLHGPEMLRHNQADWPRRPDDTAAVEEKDEELRSRFVMLTTPCDPLIDANQYSELSRLTRIMALVLRFVKNAQHSTLDKTKGGLSARELRDAEEQLCRMAQADGFAEERNALLTGRTVEPSSKIQKLQPYLDDSGTMRMCGRADAATALPEETRRPIILPRDHRVTFLIVDRAHRLMRHQNRDAVVCAIRQRFWVPQLGGLVKKIAGQCQLCRIRSAKPVAPLMGQLPADRLTPFVRPFSYTGLDYFGPLAVTIGRRHEKRWVALFTCLTTRALHLELAADLSADGCILCIRNFMNVRGVPVRIRSDNGTNFVGADKILRNMTEQLTHASIGCELASKGVEWVFNSPSHPEAGGCWERMVRCVKRVLAITMRETAPRVETLRSLLLEAANIVNSRPLTHLPVDPDTEEPLTPNHFLLGCASNTQTPGDVDARELCNKKQWRVLQQLKDRYWRRWIHEYLPELTRRTKWHKETAPVKVGDLVMICDDNESCNRWRRGRVSQVYPGPDGRVRNVLVKTADGELRRPVSRLAVLDVEPCK